MSLASITSTSTAAKDSYFSLLSSNTTPSYDGFRDDGDGIPLTYNGVKVIYFPKSFVEKGTTTGSLSSYQYPTSGGYSYSNGNVLWFGNGTFLDKRSWELLKPAKLDQSMIDALAAKTNTSEISSSTYKWSVTGQTYQREYDVRNIPDFADGYIVEQEAFQKIATEVTGNSLGIRLAYSPYRIPSAIGTAPDGNLSYVGYTTGGANDRRSDLFYLNNSSAAKYGYMQYSWQDCGIFGCSFSDFLSSTLGQLVILGARIINPWFNLGYTIGDVALRDGKIGDVALAVINLNTPTPGGTTPAAGTVFEIPQIAKATSTIAGAIQSTGVITDAAKAAEAAKLIMNTGLTYLSNGQDFNKAFLSAAGTLLGQQASQQLVSSLSVQSADIAKIMTSTTTATTKAMLLNQDVQKAAMSAFVSTSIPLALDGALKGAGLTLSTTAKKAISDAATTAALLPNANVSEVIRSAVAGTLVDGALSKVTSQLASAGVISTNDTAMISKIKNYIGPLLSGRSVSELMNSSIVADAIKAADAEGKNFVAKDKGWSDWTTWQNAKSLFGSTVTPQFYEDRVISPEKIIKILEQENVPAADRQNIIDFYKGMAGKDTTAEQVLADVRKFVNPLYFTQAEQQYLNNVFSKVEGFDSDYYKEEYDKAISAAKKGDFTTVEKIAEYINKDYTSTTEAVSLLKEAFSGVGEANYTPTQEQISQIKGYNQPTAYTIAQNIAALKTTTFDGKGYATPQEASAAAKQNGYNTFEASDGNTYKVISVLSEAEIRANIESKATFSEAFAAARAELGAGRTFLWNGKQYTTNVLPDGVFDGSRSSTVDVAATLAYSKGQDRFIGPDGKIYTLNAQAKSILDNAVNQTPAETQRLLRQAVAPMPDETKAETQRLMDSGTRGTMDTISAITSQTLGTTQRGIANFLTNAGKTYAAMTGDLSFDNALVRLGNEVEQYAKRNDAYGLDIQKERIENAIRLSGETTSFIEKAKIIGAALKNNPLGFFDIAGSEIIEEIPETVVQIGAVLATGGATLAASGAVSAISAAGSIVESFGNSTESAYKAAKAQGFSEERAIDKGYLNGMVSTLLEMGPEIVADKMLVGSLLKATGNSLVGLGAGVVSNAAVGAATGLVSGTSQSYAEQLIVNPNTANFSKAVSDGVFEGFIAGNVSAGLYGTSYALMPSAVIGKSYNGEDVTLADVIQGTKNLDSSSVRTDISVVTTENGNALTLGGMFTILPDNNFSAELQKTYLPQIFDNPNMVVGKDSLGNNITYAQIENQVTEGKTYADVFNDIVNPTFDVKADRQKTFIADQYRSIGFTPTQQQIDDVVAENPESSQSLTVNAKKLAFTEIAKQENFSVTPETLDRVTAQDSTIKTVDDFKAYIDPMAVTTDEARTMLQQQGYTAPTNAQINELITKTEQDAQLRAIQIADPYYFDAEEIKAIAAEEGYRITDDQARALARETLESEAAAAYRAQIDPLAVTRAEATEFFNQFGYPPNEQELAQFIASRSENEIRDDINKYVDPRQVTRQEAQQFFAMFGYTPTEEEIQRYIQQGPTTAETEILRQLGEYVDPRVVSEQEVRDAYASLGLKLPTLADVQKFAGQYSEADLFGKTQEYLQSAKINSIYEQLEAFTNYTSLSGIQKLVVDELVRQGLDMTTAIAAVKDELTTNIDERYNALADQQKQIVNQLVSQGLDLSTAIKTVKGELSTEIQTAYNSLSDQQKQLADRLTQSGVDFSVAIETARGELTADIQTKYNSLTDQQKALADQLVQQGVDLNTAMQAIEGRLTQGIEVAYSDLTAQQKLLADQLVQQGVDLTTAINAVKGELTTDIQQKYDALTDQQKQLAQELVNQGVDLTTAMQAIKGELSEDIQVKYNALTDQQKALADQLTKQGVDLNTAIETARTELTQDIRQRYDSLTDQQKALADQLTKQGVDLNTAIQAARTELATDVQTKYDTLTAQQKDIADQLIRQGVDLTTAINAASGEFKAGQEELQKQIAANEAARVAAEEQKAAEAKSRDLFQRASGLLGIPALTGLAAPTAAAPETQYQWKKPFITSTGKQEEFQGSLAGFQKEVEEGSYLQPSFAEESPGMREYMGMEENTQQGESMPNYFTYGDQTDIDEIFNPFGPQATSFNEFEPFMAASGGLVPPLMAGGGSTRYGKYAGGGLPVVAHSGKARLDFRAGAAVTGPGDGQSDDIPAMLADGEFVIPADVVAALGNGSTKAGSDKLYDMMHSIRAHHRSAHPKDLPPAAKPSPLDYLKKSSKGRR